MMSKKNDVLVACHRSNALCHSCRNLLRFRSRPNVEAVPIMISVVAVVRPDFTKIRTGL